MWLRSRTVLGTVWALYIPNCSQCEQSTTYYFYWRMWTFINFQQHMYNTVDRTLHDTNHTSTIVLLHCRKSFQWQSTVFLLLVTTASIWLFRFCPQGSSTNKKVLDMQKPTVQKWNPEVLCLFLASTELPHNGNTPFQHSPQVVVFNYRQLVITHFTSNYHSTDMIQELLLLPLDCL